MKRQLLRIGICLCTMSLLFSGIFPILPPLEAHAATTVVLTPGQTYNFSDKSDYKKWGAYYVDIKKGGAYYLRGSAKNTMLRIDPSEGEETVVYLQSIADDIFQLVSASI